MKTKAPAILLVITLLAPTVQALAAAGPREDHSSYLAWAFLGMCALIVIVQLMPVVMVVCGLVRGLVRGKALQPQAEVAPDKQG